MSLTVNIEYEAEISEWICRHPSFEYITTCTVPNDSRHCWEISNKHWGYDEQPGLAYQIMFIGKTGYGKSKTLNNLVGKDVFDTNDVISCTKELYTAMYRVDSDIPTFLMVSDLPGVGENEKADRQYREWYKDMCFASDLIVYVLRADQRDYSIDERIIGDLFPTNILKSKVLFAINFADKMEPINRKGGLSDAQRTNLDKKTWEISQKMNIPEYNVLYYSAADKINIDWLERKMAIMLKKNIS